MWLSLCFPLLRYNCQWCCHRGLWLYKSSQRQASQEKSNGSNWPEWTCRETCNQWERQKNMSSLHTTEGRQNRRRLSGMVCMEEPQVNTYVHTNKETCPHQSDTINNLFKCLKLLKQTLAVMQIIAVLSRITTSLFNSQESGMLLL